ncbi:MAG TPA: hypothetical protein VIZ43_02905 [Trebonia sp.]
MATAAESPEMCAVTMPASRRFYVHVASLGFLVAGQPSMFEEVAHALALSGASRALDQAVEDWAMFSPAGTESGPESELKRAARELHDKAADALRVAFQCIVQLVPPRFGATELLLGESEQINAWCYEDGYLTYATDEDAAAIMYAETGSLRRLRSEIRRSPDYDPSLQMISGQSLFLFDQGVGTGPGTAVFYRKQAARLLRADGGTDAAHGIDDAARARVDDALAAVVDECVSPLVVSFDGDLVRKRCIYRADLMVTMLLRGLPSAPAETS